MRALRGAAMPAASGLLLALAFPPFNVALFAYVALVPLLLHIRGLGYWAGFRKGYVFGLVFALPNMFWLEQFVSKWTGSALLGALPWLIVSSALAVYFALFAGAAAKAWQWNVPWAIPLVWAGVEVLRSRMPYLFFPWSLLAAAPWKTPLLLSPANWGGPFFLSAAICLFSVVTVMFLRREWFSGRVVLYHVLACVALLTLSVAAYLRPLEGTTLRVAAIQPGVDLAFSSAPERDSALRENVPKALAIGAAVKRDLLVLPEGISQWYSKKPEAPFPLEFPGPVLMGGQRRTAQGTFQSLFAYDGKWQFADKVKLVIFGEYVPFRDSLGFLSSFDLPGGDLRPATESVTLTVAGKKVGGLLCFEALFEEIARRHAANGAQILAILSLDDWYQNTGAIDALKAGAVLRAVENRLPVVRAASLGPSMIINAKGEIVAQAEPRKIAVAQAEVLSQPGASSPFRDAFPWLALAAWLVVTALPKKRHLGGT